MTAPASAPSPSTPQTILFVHIPKAAGMTLNRILRRQYGMRRVFAVKSGPFEHSLDYLRQLPAAQKRQYRVIRGHFNYGLHAELPQSSTYITLLRHPVDRMISHYYYVRSSPTHYLHSQVAGGTLSLQDYMASGLTIELDNHQTRMIAGSAAGLEPTAACSAETLAIAQQHLAQQFAVVGTVERFDETLVVLQQTFGWSIPFYARLNVTQNRPRKTSVDPAALAVIEAHNQLDLELYRFANQRLDALIQQVRYFRLKLWRFQVLNRLYTWIYQAETRLSPALSQRIRAFRRRLESPWKFK